MVCVVCDCVPCLLGRSFRRAAGGGQRGAELEPALGVAHICMPRLSCFFATSTIFFERDSVRGTLFRASSSCRPHPFPQTHPHTRHGRKRPESAAGSRRHVAHLPHHQRDVQRPRWCSPWRIHAAVLTAVPRGTTCSRRSATCLWTSLKEGSPPRAVRSSMHLRPHLNAPPKHAHNSQPHSDELLRYTLRRDHRKVHTSRYREKPEP